MFAAIAPWLRMSLLFIFATLVIALGFYVGTFFDDRTRHILGYLGTFAMLFAQMYWARKRVAGLARFGTLKVWLERHEFLTLFGSFLVIVHAGDGTPPRGMALITFILMLVTVISGATGSFIHKQILKEKSELRARLKSQGLSPEQIEDEMYAVSFSEEAFRNWKRVHHPITMAFFAMLVLHMFSMIFFGGIIDHA